MGDEYLNTEEENDKYAKTYDINDFKIHPKYDQRQNFDIALVATNQTIEFNKLTKPICLPNKPVETDEPLSQRGGQSVRFSGKFNLFT